MVVQLVCHGVIWFICKKHAYIMNKKKLFTLTLQQQESSWFKTLHLRIITKGNKPSTLRIILLLLIHYRDIPKYSNFTITINCSHLQSYPTAAHDQPSLN